MPTLNQLIRGMRRLKRQLDWTPDLHGNPQRKGLCTKVAYRAPKKPNSAKRRIAKVELFQGRSRSKPLWVYVPGKGSALDKHANVLVRGGRVPDLPGVKYRVVRGKYDMHSVLDRKCGRSKYGTKNWVKKVGYDPLKKSIKKVISKHRPRWNFPFYTPGAHFKAKRFWGRR